MNLRKCLKLLVILSVPACAFSNFALAITSNELRPQDNQIFLGLQGNQYFNNANTLADKKSGNIGAKASIRKVSKNDKSFRGAFDGEGYAGLGNARYHYIDVSEGYVGIANPSLAFYLGRKRHNWNSLDSYWSMGLYQPRFRWDYLNERPSGLVGFFFQATQDQDLSEFTAFYSPIFIPEQGAPFDITNGECKSSSPWFHCPSSAVMLFNQSTNVKYKLNVPPISKLIDHESYGASLRLGRENKFYGKVSYANKPINQFILAFEGRLDLTTLDLPASIHLRVLRHEIFSGEMGGALGNAGFLSVSAIKEDPKKDFPPSNWTTQETSEARFLGAIFRTNNFFGLYDSKTRLELSYLHRDGGDAKDKGPFATQNTSLFEPRFAFKNAFSLGVFSPIKDEWSSKFLFSMKYIVDTIYNGNILNLDFHYKVMRRSYVSLGADFLGSETLTPVDFISKNQSNDRIRGGFIYVF